MLTSKIPEYNYKKNYFRCYQFVWYGSTSRLFLAILDYLLVLFIIIIGEKKL